MIVLRCIWPQCAFGHQIVINEKPVHHGFNRRFAWQQWKPKFCVAFTWTSVTSRPYKYGHAHIYGLYPGLSKNMAHAWSIVSFGFRPRISRLRGGGKYLLWTRANVWHNRNIVFLGPCTITIPKIYHMYGLSLTLGQVHSLVKFTVCSSSHMVKFPIGSTS